MKLAVMQPYLFPYIGYWQLMVAADKFVVLDDVNFIKKGWINRNNILINGQAQLFTVPLKEVSQNKLIREIMLSDEDAWKNKFHRTIEMAYKKAPFFNHVAPLLKTIIDSPEKNCSAYIFNSFQQILAYLELNKEFTVSSSVYDNRHLKGEEKIIDICLKEKADQYINPIGGMELYSRDKFNGKNIRLNFLKSKPVSYTQFGNEFIPWLSIIDVLMFNPPEKIRAFLKEYELI